MFIECDLSKYNDISLEDIYNNKINDEQLKKYGLERKIWTTNDKPFMFIKYNKEYLSLENINSLGLFRSVIIYNGKIKVFSPPKSVNINIFANTFPANECIAEEFVEGTMINLFFDESKNDWEIATKNSIGGKVKFFQEQEYFRTLFEDICREKQINFSNLPKENCYSFVIQHPNNRFVIPVTNKRVCLVGVYNINNFYIKELDKKEFVHLINGVDIPYSLTFENYEQLFSNYGSMETHYTIMGAIIKHNSGIRSKMRNPNYENLKILRGNTPKLQYQYLSLRKDQNVKNFLTYFPENKNKFTSYRNQIHNFTKNLHSYYIKCFINKEITLKDCPFEFRTHLYTLHKKYIDNREKKFIVTKPVVIEYINTLHPAQLMHSLNYNLYGHVKEKMKKMELN